MLNLGAVLTAVDAVVMLRDAAKRFKTSTAEPAHASGTGSSDPTMDMATAPPAEQGVARHLEATLTNVVVAALKEAFDRDHSRLELERLQIEEQRRRAEESLRLELRRQAADREVGRLRLLAAAALFGWIASLLMFVLRAGVVATPARMTLAAGWLLLLGALGSAFHAQGRLGANVSDASRPLDAGVAAPAALWLLVAGLAATAVSLLL